MTENEILKELHFKFGDLILNNSFPKPYCKNLDTVKAILLGCDPTNKFSANLPYVFALESGLPIFNSFIAHWERSLNEIGLSLNNVYIQNLCKNYFVTETSCNRKWDKVARFWIPYLKEELCMFPKNIPVLLSSERLYKVLLNDDVGANKAIEIYQGKSFNSNN